MAVQVCGPNCDRNLCYRLVLSKSVSEKSVTLYRCFMSLGRPLVDSGQNDTIWEPHHRTTSSLPRSTYPYDRHCKIFGKKERTTYYDRLYATEDAYKTMR